ncbi:unnamed protein product [Sphagnum troendelagicum]|uniref:Uncharacterized protein n=1 Tax=Sphagnum troendelagicum TaxID=128251 RepID=A0ABP0V4K4_9BRYO
MFVKRSSGLGRSARLRLLFKDGAIPPCYDNIENHLRNQHSGQWAVYQALESSFERTSFFNDVSVAFKNSIKAHFPSSSLGAERQIVYDIEKDIVDTIVGDMMFNPEDQDDSDVDHDADKEPAFGNAAEINVLHLRHRQAAAKVKERALSLFKRVESEDDVAIYSYSVTIPKTKTTLFCLVMRYVSCGTSFRMAIKLIGYTYDVLGNLGSRVCSRDEISNFVRAVCVVNLQRITDLLRRSWAFSLALDSVTHQSTSFLNLHFRIFVPNYHSIVNLHGCTLPMFDRHTGDIMSTMRNALDNLIASFIDDVGVIGLLTTESIANTDPSTHVISGHYAIVLSNVREFLVGLAFWVDTLLNEADESDQNAVNTTSPLFTTVESDFSIMRWDKDLFRKRLSNFGLERFMQAKHFLFIEQFQH